MDKNIKHYLAVGGILCAIGASSALLIGLTNMLTSGPIEASQKTKEEKALKEVFVDEDGNLPTDIVIGEKTDINKDRLLCFWNPKAQSEGANEDNKYGYVFKTEGADKNNYGTITMLVAINNDFSIGKISIIKNTESYATTVQKDYVDKYNSGDKTLNDVTCGATFGATVIKEMAESARDYAKGVLNNGK